MGLGSPNFSFGSGKLYPSSGGIPSIHPGTSAWFSISREYPASPRNQEGLDTELRVEPIPGIKAAYLVAMPHGEVQFTGVGHGQAFPYKAVDTMKCPYGHTTPEHHGDETHGCGFYAYENASLLSMHMLFTTPSVLLNVEHYGTTVAHKLGSRGQKQRVLAATVVYCFCGESSPTGFILKENTYFSPVQNAPKSLFMGACAKHTEGRVSIAAMASALGTEVRVGTMEGLSRIV